MKFFSERGGRFFRLALMLGGPAIWSAVAILMIDYVRTGQIPNMDWVQPFGIGIATIIGACGLGSGANKYGSAQQERARIIREDEHI